MLEFVVEILLFSAASGTVGSSRFNDVCLFSSDKLICPDPRNLFLIADNDIEPEANEASFEIVNVILN